MPHDDYQKIREIYMGTFGRAFLSQRIVDKKPVTIKEFCFAGLDVEERQAALREVNALTQLKHPYIVRYCEKFMHDSQLCMVFDEGEEGSLWAFIRLCGRQKTFMPEAQVLRWFTQIALAVKYLHERPHPILHRDIKTQNVFLAKKDKEGTCAKLFIEFGPMKVLDHPGSALRAPVGTQFCQAPEILNRLPYSTPSDIWSLGCVLYELCAAHVSWEADDIPEHMENIMISPLYHISGRYSHELGTIASSLLEHDPIERPTADEILKMDIVQMEMRRMLKGRHEAAAKEAPPPQSYRAMYRDNSARNEVRESRDLPSAPGYERPCTGSARPVTGASRPCTGSARSREGSHHRESCENLDEVGRYIQQMNQQRDGAPIMRNSPVLSARGGKDGETSARPQVRPLGEHNPRRPRTMRSASPGVTEAAKLMMMQETSSRPRASSRTSATPREPAREPSREPAYEPTCMSSRRQPSSRAASPRTTPRQDIETRLAQLLLADGIDGGDPARW